LVWAVSISLIVYALLSFGALRRTMLVLVKPIVSLAAHSRPAPPDDSIFGLSHVDLPSHIVVFGLPIPLSVLITAAMTMPALLIANDIAHWHRRRTRDRLGQCLDCGYQLTTHRGRCRGCGVRIGPG
jgi:hypothetical protein